MKSPNICLQLCKQFNQHQATWRERKIFSFFFRFFLLLLLLLVARLGVMRMQHERVCNLIVSCFVLYHQQSRLSYSLVVVWRFNLGIDCSRVYLTCYASFFRSFFLSTSQFFSISSLQTHTHFAMFRVYQLH